MRTITGLAGALAFAIIGLAPSPAPAVSTRPDCVTGIVDTLEIPVWKVLGPFSAGPREAAVEPAWDPSGAAPDSSVRHPSTLAPGGRVAWRTAAVDSAGWVAVEFGGVPWDTLMDIYGYAGIANVAYAYAEVEMPSEARALVDAERVGSFWLNGRQFPGDPYGHGFMRVPVPLDQGTNRIAVEVSGYGDHTFRLVLLPVPGPVITVADYTLPDIVRGETGARWLGIPILNTTGKVFKDIRASAGDGLLTTLVERTIPRLEPFCIVKVPIEISVTATPDSGDVLKVPVAVETEGNVYRDTLDLRLRDGSQSALRTFISRIDGSCQQYAVLPPTDRRAGELYSLILTLHGAGVRAENQADAYRPKPWAYVVAPTNRRPYGFDWQDWGRIDALEVLATAKSTLPIDTNMVYLAGHSMGGHGTWHVGLTHPDLFAAMAPAAGWTCFELYIPWFLQKAYIYGEPAQRGIRETALRQDWPHTFVENARNLPTFILQGGADDNVPPFHSRLFAARLAELGYHYRYKEDPGKGHWYTIDSLGVACVDDPDLMGFIEGKRRDVWPRKVVFKTVNPSESRRAYWLEIVEQEDLYRESTIRAEVRSDTVSIDARNVRSFAVTLSRDLVASGSAVLLLEGRSHHLRFNDTETIRFTRRGGRFRPGANAAARVTKEPRLYGPIKQAMFSPFILCYGTSAGPEVTDLLLHLARLEAFQWWRRGNGFVEIVPDSEVTRKIMADNNFIVFGGPHENSIIRLIERRLPIRISSEGIILGDTPICGNGLAVKFIYPNPLAPDKLVVVNAGTDAEGLGLLPAMGGVYAGAGLPDFVVFNREVKRLGWGGVTAAGFFDSAWRLEPDLMYLRDR